jgi:hypothetical protein
MFNSLNTLKENKTNVEPIDTKKTVSNTVPLKRIPDKFYLDEDLYYGEGVPKINVMSTKTPTPIATFPTISPIIKPVTSASNDEFEKDKIKDTRFYSDYDNKFKPKHNIYDDLSFYNEPIIKPTTKPTTKPIIQPTATLYKTPKPVNYYTQQPDTTSLQTTPIPYRVDLIDPVDQIDLIDSIENFNSDCNNHIMTCNKCKELYDRHYKLNNDTKYSEIWDILSYILFAIVIIFLLDKF